MINHNKNLNRWALITGASSGIGRTFSEKLAEMNYHLILHGRNEKKLELLKKELEKKFEIQIKILILDLTEFEGSLILETLLNNIDNLEFLVNNAGYWQPGEFINRNPEEIKKMVIIHSIIPAILINLAMKKMIKQKCGNIINITSLNAFVPFPGRENYSASKSYLTTLTKCLFPTLKAHNIKILAVAPGSVKTDFLLRNGMDQRGMSTEFVVKQSLKALDKDKWLLVPGWKNRFTFRFLNLLPMKFRFKILSNLQNLIFKVINSTTKNVLKSNL